MPGVRASLCEVMDEIETVRQRKRDAKGWIMDSYILQRRK